MQSITKFLERRLKLKVNEAKSAVARPWKRKFLGFSFTSGNTPKRRIASQAVIRLKDKVRGMTSRNRGGAIHDIAEELASYLTGWRGYFGICETPSVLQALDQWIRRRIRSLIWRRWKRGTVRYKELRKRGLHERQAAAAACTTSPWRASGLAALHAAFPMAYFKDLGIPALLTTSNA